MGVGLIGRAWANVFARAGWQVRVWDADRAVAAGAPELIERSLHDVARHGLAEDAAAAAKRVTVAGSLDEAVADAELVIESGPERIEVKLEVFGKLDAAARADAILASSSSAIVASRFTENAEGPRSAAWWRIPSTRRTWCRSSSWPARRGPRARRSSRARAIFESVGQVPIEVKKEIDGFILNRMQAVLLSEAFRLVGEGYVSAEDLDKTIRDGLGLRWAFMGPFETIELNAPGGIPDYCARYGETLLKLSSAPVTPAVWGKDNVARAVESWGRNPSNDDDRRQEPLARRAHRRAGGAQEGQPQS